MSIDHPTPFDQRELAFIATDDFLLIHRDPDLGRRTLSKLEAEMERAGVPRNKDKDIILEREIVGLGCELSCRPALCTPAAGNLRKLALGLLVFFGRPTASPKSVSALLGLAQCFLLYAERHVYNL